MPTFHLHLRNDGRIEDGEGGDHADLDAARREAVAADREIMSERMRAGEVLDGSAIEICDASGTLLETVRFRDAFRLASDQR